MLEFTFCHGLENAPDAKNIRTAVFVCEQGFTPELEFDVYDAAAVHIVGAAFGKPVCAGRLFHENGAKNGTLHVGRICVLKEERGKHYGQALLLAIEEEARRQSAAVLELGAQTGAVPFYEKLGYKSYGDIFYDEAVPHIMMAKSLL